MNLYVYPMGDNERSMAFSINKTALANAQALSYNQKLNHIGELLGCSNLVDIKPNEFKNAAFDFIKVNTNLTLISYHNAQGGIINDALDAAGQLMPIQNGAINTCRPNGICFAKVRASINLTDLDDTIGIIPTKHFIRLPTNNSVVNNAAGNPRTLHTFDGPSDWLVISAAAYQTLIYSHADSVHEPFDLRAPEFTSPEAIPDIETRVNKIEEDISKAAWSALLAKTLRQVCPNFLHDPYKTLNRVRQVTTVDGETITQTVRQYHEHIQLVISTFGKSFPNWPANPFKIHMDNLAPEGKNKAEQNGFRTHTQTVSTSPHDQVNLIQTGYEAARLAEKELAGNHTFIRNELSSAHGFLTIAGLPPGLPPTRSSYPPAAHTFASPAETVMQDRHQPSCAGCGDLSHMYYDKRSKTTTCPKKDIPDVRARADAWLKDFRERAKQHRHQKSRSTKAFISKIISQMKMSANQEGHPLPTTTDAVVLINTIVLPASGKLPPLPIQIYPSLPHLELKLGTAESDFQPSISAIIDSGSCPCTGNWDYVMGIAKAYTHNSSRASPSPRIAMPPSSFLVSFLTTKPLTLTPLTCHASSNFTCHTSPTAVYADSLENRNRQASRRKCPHRHEVYDSCKADRQPQ
jgi:hypothetical protein